MPTTRSTNVEAGFSIMRTTGSDTSGQRIPHGLGKTPEFIMCKQLDNAYNWDVFHKDLTAGSTLIQNSNTGQDGTRDAFYNAGAGPVDSQFVYSKDEFACSGGGKRSVLYTWTSVEGFSKFGSYTGNGSSPHGPFCYTGFKPACIIIKSVSGGSPYPVSYTHLTLPTKA